MRIAGALRFLTLVAGLLLAGGAAATATITGKEREVQVLANFPALQKLSRDEGALRVFLRRVAGTYQDAGYGAFSRELRRSGALVALYGRPEQGAKAMRQARAAQRRLEKALVRNPFVRLPVAEGDAVPDYFGIASTFVNSAAIALKNMSLGKNVANTLRKTKGTLWLVKNAGDQFTLSGSEIGSVTFSSSGAFANFTFAVNTTAGFGSVGSAGILNPGGALAILAGKVVAFPPGIDLPLDQDYVVNQSWTPPQTGGGPQFPAGAQFIFIDRTFLIPDGASEVAGGGMLSLTTQNSTAWGIGIRSLGSVINLGNYRLVGATATVQAGLFAAWLAFPPEALVPEALQAGTLLLGRAYSVGGVTFPAGTRIARVPAADVVPEGAVVLPAGDFVLAPVPIPAP